jgi:transcription antitermination protein NusB
MKVRKSNRRELREKVLQVLYAYEFNGEGLTSLTEGILTDVESEVDRNFAKQLINHVVANQKMLNEIIKERLANWEMDRVALIDRILLKIGIAEIFFFQEIPPKVSINEVIEIAKDYSTSNSGKFINGILDAILSDLKKSGKLKKTGRGLIEESFTKTTDEN